MSHLSDLVLDALAAGEGSPAAEAHLATCGECAARRDELAVAATAFRARFDPVQLAATTGAAVPERRFWPAVVTAAAAAAAVMVAVSWPVAEPGSGLRTKGAGQALDVFEMRDGEPVRAEAAAPGGAFRIRYDPGPRAYTRILWRDADGALEALEPSTIGPARPTRERGPRWARLQYRLDEERRAESAVAVFCDDDFDHARAVRAASGGVAGCEVVERRVEKRVGAQ